MNRLIPTLFLVALVISACATTGGGESGRRQRNVITAADLAQIPEFTAYDAIQRLRPRWLSMSRVVGVTGETHQSPKVIVDGMPQGDINALHQYLDQDILELRFMSAADATTRYGTGYPVGAIVVQTRR
jgi:hypothetical protein